MIDAFNLNVIKQKKKNLEMLSSDAIKPKEIGIKLNKGVIFCTDDRYKIKEINEEQAMETLRRNEVNYSLWQEYMSNSEDKGSAHLTGIGLGGGQLL